MFKKTATLFLFAISLSNAESFDYKFKIEINDGNEVCTSDANGIAKMNETFTFFHRGSYLATARIYKNLKNDFVVGFNICKYDNKTSECLGEMRGSIPFNGGVPSEYLATRNLQNEISISCNVAPVVK
jgi:hypothetical protein